VTIQNDAERLACYDQATGRSALTPTEADRAADAARQAREATRAPEAPLTHAEQARRDLSEALFPHEDDAYRDLIANAGRGSLLDSRWELARDSKRGIFNFRAYKPVYLMPVFWTSDTNRTPSSPNPRNTVTTPQDVQNTE